MMSFLYLHLKLKSFYVQICLKLFNIIIRHTMPHLVIPNILVVYIYIDNYLIP